jgi:hypothetical protein
MEELAAELGRTAIAEPIGETRAAVPFTGDQVGLFRAQPGRRVGVWRGGCRQLIVVPADLFVPDLYRAGRL